MIEQPGFRWCEACKQQIPDAFADHFERHEQEQAVDRETTGVIVFWSYCVALGAIAAMVANTFIP